MNQLKHLRSCQKKMEKLFYEIFSDLPRQGPGSAISTLKAAKLISRIFDHPKILDIGCGTGTQTIELIKYFAGTVYAIDNNQPYLDVLSAEASRLGFEDNLVCLNADMLQPGFVTGKFDLIWAEGSIYIVGFEKGLDAFKILLKPKGYIAVTELSWIKSNPPEELSKFWEQEYPAINNIQSNLKIIESLGYKLIDHFILPDSAWMDDYYIPLEERLVFLREKYRMDEKAQEMFDYVQKEIDVFHKYSEYYGYVFYVMQNSA